jgi:hypothetical protein
MSYWGGEPLQRLDAFSDLAVCVIAVAEGRILLNDGCLQMKTQNWQPTERKHVNIRELCVALQLPIGDDVSALHPLRSSVPPFLRFGCLRSKWRLQRSRRSSSLS